MVYSSIKFTDFEVKVTNASNVDEVKEDPFDINMKTIELKPAIPHTELVTSRSLCTPGCGNTGTYNSYCC